MRNARDMQRPLTQEEKLQNLVEGLCEEPFALKSLDDIPFDYAHLLKAKKNLKDFAERFAKERSLVQEEINSTSAAELSRPFGKSSTEKDKEHPDGPPSSRKS